MHGSDTDVSASPRRWWILVILCLNLVLVVAANSSVNVALPTMVAELNASQTQLQWIVDAYAIVFAGLLLPMGAIADRFGRKGTMQTGLVIYGLAALAASTANDATTVIAARAVMGVGAAAVMPSTLSILTNVFPPHERQRAISIWAGFAGAGAAIGPVASGWLLTHYWWGSVFLISTVIAAGALVIGFLIVPTSKDPEATPLDPVAGLLSTLGFATLLYGIIEGPERGWTDPLTIVSFACAAVGLVTFVLWERRRANPMLDMGFFSNPRFSVGASVIAFTFLSMFGMLFLLTQYLQFVKSYSPLEAGVAMLPMALTLVIVAPRSAPAIVRWGQRRVIGFGLLTVCAGLAILGVFISPDLNYWIVAACLVLVAAGVGMTTAPSTGLIMSSLPLRKAGVGSAVNDTTREVGGAVGVAVLGSIVGVLYRTGLGDAAAALPAQALDAARRSVGGALGVAAAMQGRMPEEAAALAASARKAFTDGLALALVIGAAVAAVAAAVVWHFLRGVDFGSHGHGEPLPAAAEAEAVAPTDRVTEA